MNNKIKPNKVFHYSFTFAERVGEWAIILFLTMLSISCGSSSSNKVEINFWAMGAEGEQVQKLIPEFEKRNPGVTVKVQMIPWTAAQEKLITAYASENTPDICQLGNTWVPQFVALDALEDLNSWLKNTSVKKENYFEGIWNTNVIDDKPYGIPWYVDTRLMFYRTDVFENAGFSTPPKTWDELYTLCKRIKKNVKGQDKYAIYLPANEWAPFIIFGLQNGSSILKNNNSYGDFSNNKFKEAFRFVTRFHKEDLAPIGFSQVTNVYQALADEYFSIYISGPWNINEFKRWMTGNLADKWMTAPLPGPSGYPGASLAGGSSLVMFKESKNKKEVWKLIEYLSEPATQIKLYQLLYDLPAVKQAWQDTTLKNNKYMDAFYIQFQNVIATPKITEWEQIAFSKVQQYAEAAIRGVKTNEECLNGLDADVNTILEKRRWMLNRK
ncbi:MAG: sugar ABC transporter substrate-binding protein [Ignavibacteriales bacterium]|nr:sugar ABC transporter substrate-binding protein [Ignavibacteriales bacterium]